MEGKNWLHMSQQMKGPTEKSHLLVVTLMRPERLAPCGRRSDCGELHTAEPNTTVRDVVKTTCNEGRRKGWNGHLETTAERKLFFSF